MGCVREAWEQSTRPQSYPLTSPKLRCRDGSPLTQPPKDLVRTGGAGAANKQMCSSSLRSPQLSVFVSSLSSERPKHTCPSAGLTCDSQHPSSHCHQRDVTAKASAKDQTLVGVICNHSCIPKAIIK